MWFFFFFLTTKGWNRSRVIFQFFISSWQEPLDSLKICTNINRNTYSTDCFQMVHIPKHICIDLNYHWAIEPKPQRCECTPPNRTVNTLSWLHVKAIFEQTQQLMFSLGNIRAKRLVLTRVDGNLAFWDAPEMRRWSCVRCFCTAEHHCTSQHYRGHVSNWPVGENKRKKNEIRGKSLMGWDVRPAASGDDQRDDRLNQRSPLRLCPCASSLSLSLSSPVACRCYYLPLSLISTHCTWITSFCDLMLLVFLFVFSPLVCSHFLCSWVFVEKMHRNDAAMQKN